MCWRRGTGASTQPDNMENAFTILESHVAGFNFLFTSNHPTHHQTGAKGFVLSNGDKVEVCVPVSSRQAMILRDKLRPLFKNQTILAIDHGSGKISLRAQGIKYHADLRNVTMTVVKFLNEDDTTRH